MTGLTVGNILKAWSSTTGIVEHKSTVVVLLRDGHDVLISLFCLRAPRLLPMAESKLPAHTNIILFLCFVMYYYHQPLIRPFSYLPACAHRYG